MPAFDDFPSPLLQFRQCLNISMLRARKNKAAPRRSRPLGESGNSRLSPASQIVQTSSTRSWQFVDENNKIPPLPLSRYTTVNTVHKCLEPLTKLPAAQSKRKKSLVRKNTGHDTSQDHSASAIFTESRADADLAATGGGLEGCAQQGQSLHLEDPGAFNHMV